MSTAEQTAAVPPTDQLSGLIAEVLGVPGTELSEDSGPGAHVAWTSLKHVEVVVVLEEHYGVALSSREIKGITSIAGLRRLLADKGVAGVAP
ncbi:acyl carrier protein [Streptomyces sp. IBSBF 2953]|uniref:phosphopantetheine-binding protein n=1 Tax=Streptomyces TaxID=1883 RepID=UPI00211A8C96|nr:phosphopantetheine-binding protein [Streptomyces scabiei]MCQ9178867.1 acyl carrier protein [Streptomyces hayashii]MDX3112507.1 phosphopantetheine-binding protein [Streptomyces scabiei]